MRVHFERFLVTAGLIRFDGTQRERDPWEETSTEEEDEIEE